MKVQDEKLKHFIDDAVFLEKNKLQIAVELEGIKKKHKKESERNQYRFSEKEFTFGMAILILVLYAIAMLLVHFIIVPLAHAIIIDLIISMFRGFKEMPPCKTFDIVCDIILGILLFIPVSVFVGGYIEERIIDKKEHKKKLIHDNKEEQRLKHFNSVILPKMQDTENELKKEYDLYDSEIQQLYELEVIPYEYCNLEAMLVMKKYIQKYKVSDRKQLLNACDKYFQYKDLKQGVQNAQQRLDDAEVRIIDSFEDMAYSMESQMNSLMMKIESQNYDLESLQERTEREKRNTELLLYWNLID